MTEDTNEQTSEEESGEINLFDYLIVLAKHKTLIISITLLVTIGTLVSTLFIPNTYWARSTVLLPQSRERGFVGRILQQIGVAGSADTSIKDPSLFAQLLYTGPVLDRVIEQFGLAKHYGDELSKKDIRDTLSSSMTTDFIMPDSFNKRIGPSTSRILMISVIDKDPALAADIANAFVVALSDFLKGIAVTEAAQRRLFFETQLKEAKAALIASEEAMKEFQKDTGILKADAQASAMIEGIAHLRTKLIENEVKLNVMKSYSTANNPDMQKLEETIIGLKRELSKLEGKEENNRDTYLSSRDMSAIGADYGRKLRDLKYNESMFEILSKQYEVARMQELQEPAIIQVLEKAYPTEERAGPERRKKVVKAAAGSFFLSVILVLLMEYLKKYRAVNPENREKIETLKKHLSFRKARS